jgi:GT2 family glycosyltransferase
VTVLSIVAICIDPDRPILDRFLSSVRQYTTGDSELILVDNAGSDAATSAFLASAADRYIRVETRANVAAAWNLGVAAATGDYVLVTNDDVVVPRRWFEQLREVIETHDRVGMVVPVMNYALPIQSHVGDHGSLRGIRPVRLVPFEQFVWGAFMLFAREALTKVGGFSEEYPTAGSEDLDMCFRLFEGGFDIYVDHRVFVYHEWGSTGVRLLGAEQREALYLVNYDQFKARWHRYTAHWDQPPPPERWWHRARRWLAARIAP